MISSDILGNAGRLLSDAQHLHEAGRSRSAATLVVTALEQLGAFVEALTTEKHRGAIAHIGIFGDRPNAHARRQDVLAAHVLNYALGQLVKQFAFEVFFRKTGCGEVKLA